MDIKKWLEDTSVPEQPSLPEQLGLPSFLYPREDTAEHGEGRHRHRKRKLPSTNSSFIEAEAPPADLTPNDHRLKRKRIEEDEATTNDSYLSEPSEDTKRSPSPRYERRPRAKPRSDLYEPKDERGKKHKRHRKKKHQSEEETKREKRKLRRKKEKPSAGLVHSFHAKNVPKDRLTQLKPGGALGLFKKGRASSPVRGRGLPDLVFSEMSFLKKRKDNTEDQENEQPKKSRKKDRARVNDEEVSAYFKAKRPALTEKDVNVASNPHPSHRRSSVPLEQSRKRQQSMTVEPAIPTVELPGKPYLGFGSRGNRPPSTTYQSWSESVRHASNPPAFRGAIRAIDVGELKAAEAKKKSERELVSPSAKSAVPSRETTLAEHGNTTHGRASSMGSNSGGAKRKRAGDERQIRRIEEPHLMDTLRLHRRDVPSSHKDRKGVINDRRHLRDSNVQRESTRRSSITEPERPESQSTQKMGVQQDNSGNSNKENTVPRTSSPLGKLLKECEAAFVENERWTVGYLGPRHDQAVQQLAQLTTAQSSNHLTEQDITRETQPVVFDEKFPLLAFSQSEPRFFIPDENVGSLTAQIEHETFMQPFAEAEYLAVHGGGADLLDDGFGDYHAVAYEEELNEPAEGMQEQEAVEEAQGEGEDVFAGFWRPHKLY